MNVPTAQYKRVLLKLSGEALMGDASYGISPAMLNYVTEEVKKIVELGVQTCLVIGAGNIFRGVSGASAGMDRASADNMGMLATVINALALQDTFERQGIPTRVLSAIPMLTVCEAYSRHKALHHLTKNRVVIFGAGTGNPYFTTDTAALLRALEIGADLVCKATRVDGVYDKDPLKHNDAVKFNSLSYREVLQQRLKIMDAAAVSLAMDNKRKIMVFNMNIPGNMKRAIMGEQVGTLIRGEDNE